MIHIVTHTAIYTLNLTPKYQYCDVIPNALGVVVIDRTRHTVAISSPDYLEEPIKGLFETFIEIEDKINGEIL